MHKTVTNDREIKLEDDRGQTVCKEKI